MRRARRQSGSISDLFSAPVDEHAPAADDAAAPEAAHTHHDHDTVSSAGAAMVARRTKSPDSMEDADQPGSAAVKVLHTAPPVDPTIQEEAHSAAASLSVSTSSASDMTAPHGIAVDSDTAAGSADALMMVHSHQSLGDAVVIDAAQSDPDPEIITVSTSPTHDTSNLFAAARARFAAAAAGSASAADADVTKNQRIHLRSNSMQQAQLRDYLAQIRDTSATSTSDVATSSTSADGAAAVSVAVTASTHEQKQDSDSDLPADRVKANGSSDDRSAVAGSTASSSAPKACVCVCICVRVHFTSTSRIYLLELFDNIAII